jgi:RNA polymerase sigma factor (sigma-70 family)
MAIKDNVSAMSLYFKGVERTKMLTAEVERGLIRQYADTKDPIAKKRIIEGALRYVIAEARKHPRARFDPSVMSDLIAAGNIGLVRALDKFNPEAGTRFLTYASWWVRHEMREENRKLGIIHVPTHALSKGTRPPLTTELEENVHSESGAFRDTYATEIDTRHSLLKLLDITALSTREVYIVKTCFGIHTYPKTLKQIGSVLLITGERVRQLRETALVKLRQTATLNSVTF